MRENCCRESKRFKNRKRRRERKKSEASEREQARERKKTTFFFARGFSSLFALSSSRATLSPLLFFCSTPSRRGTAHDALSRHQPRIGRAENRCQWRLFRCCSCEGSTTESRRRRRRRRICRSVVVVNSRRAPAPARPLPRRGGTGAGRAVFSANASPAVGRRDEPFRLCESIDRCHHRCRRRRRRRRGQRCKLCRRRRPRGFRAPSGRARARRRQIQAAAPCGHL